MNYVASPSVRAYAGRKGVDLDRVAEKFGRELIGREDVDQFLTGGGAKPAPSANSTDHTQFWDVDHAQFGPIREEPMSRFAQVSAQNLAAANAMIPQVTHHDRADMSAVEAFRQSIKAEMVQKGVKLTALAFHLKALAATLKAFPKFNASLSPDGKTLVLKQYVHIGVAVDTPYGLLVPVVRDVDQKGVIQIANDIADIAGRAQARKIRPDELAGASMAVSSLGGIGGIGFTPIVNPHNWPFWASRAQRSCRAGMVQIGSPCLCCRST